MDRVLIKNVTPRQALGDIDCVLRIITSIEVVLGAVEASVWLAISLFCVSISAITSK